MSSPRKYKFAIFFELEGDSEAPFFHRDAQEMDLDQLYLKLTPEERKRPIQLPLEGSSSEEKEAPRVAFFLKVAEGEFFLFQSLYSKFPNTTLTGP